MNTFLRPYNPKDFKNHTYFTRHLILLLLAISSTVVHTACVPTADSIKRQTITNVISDNLRPMLYRIYCRVFIITVFRGNYSRAETIQGNTVNQTNNPKSLTLPLMV